MNRQQALRWSLVTLGFLVFTLILARGIFEGPDHLIGDGGDGYQFIWNSVHVRGSIMAGESIYRTDDLFYPFGASLVFHTLTPLYSAISFLFPFLSGVGYMNLTVIMQFVLAGVFMTAVGRALDRSWVASLAMGFAYTYFPFHVGAALGHLNLGGFEWLPLMLLGTIQKRWWLIAIGIVGSVYTSFYLSIMNAIFMACFVVVIAMRKDVAMLKQLGIGVMVAVVLVLPFILAMMSVGGPGAFDTRHDFAGEWNLDVAYLVIPSEGQWIDFLTGDLRFRYRGAGTGTWYYVGISLLVGSVVGALAFRSLRWLLAPIVIGLVLAMSSPIRFWFTETSIVGPAAFISRDVLLPVGGVDSRFFLVALPAIILLAGHGIDALLARKRWLGLVLVALLLIEFFPSPLAVAPIPDNLPSLNVPGDGPFVDVGGGWTLAVYEQTIHGRPIFGGHISRMPNSLVNDIQQFPGLRRLYCACQSEDLEEEVESYDQFLRVSGIRYTLVRDEQRAAIMDEYGYEAVDTGEAWWIYGSKS